VLQSYRDNHESWDSASARIRLVVESYAEILGQAAFARTSPRALAPSRYPFHATEQAE